MMVTLHPTFTLTVTVQPPDTGNKFINAQTSEGQCWEITRGEFWDAIKDKVGCDEVVAAVREALATSALGPHIRVTMDRFEQRPRS